jgi:hypothetical protein
VEDTPGSWWFSLGWAEAPLTACCAVLILLVLLVAVERARVGVVVYNCTPVTFVHNCTHVTFVHKLCHAAARQMQPLLRLPQSQATAAIFKQRPYSLSQTTERAHATAPRCSRTSGRQPHKHGGRGQRGLARSTCEHVAAGAGGQHAVESNKQAQWLADEHCRCRV